VLRRASDYLVYFIVRIFICIVQSLRLETCESLARSLAVLFADKLRVRAKVVEENLRIAFPEKSPEERQTLARRMWEHLFLLITEMAHTPRKYHETNWRDIVDLKNADIYTGAMLSDRPTLLVLAHFGNFELGGVTLGLLGFSTHAVARTLDNPYLAAWLDRTRQATGQHVVPKKGGYDEIVRVLAGGGTMAFLADQYGGTKGCWVDFFSRPASVHKAIALFALDNDARMIVCYTRRLGRALRYEIGVQAVFDPRDPQTVPGLDLTNIKGLTQWYTRELEQIIRRDPEQYWWIHRRWKDRRPAKRQAKQAA
jgi:KDO2-lipid IV(A) lauroyltransferase